MSYKRSYCVRSVFVPFALIGLPCEIHFRTYLFQHETKRFAHTINKPPETARTIHRSSIHAYTSGAP